MEHKCAWCPHDLTTVDKWKDGKWVSVPIVDLSNEDLLDEYASYVDGETRRHSSDAPSPGENLYEEILRRMGR